MTLARVLIFGFVASAAIAQTPSATEPLKVCTETVAKLHTLRNDPHRMAEALSRQTSPSRRRIDGIAIIATSDADLTAKEQQEGCAYVVRLHYNNLFSNGPMTFPANASPLSKDNFPGGEGESAVLHPGTDDPILVYELFKAGAKTAMARGTAMFQRTPTGDGRNSRLDINLDVLAGVIARKIARR